MSALTEGVKAINETTPGGVEVGPPSDVPEFDTGDTATPDSDDSAGGGNNYGSLSDHSIKSDDTCHFKSGYASIEKMRCGVSMAKGPRPPYQSYPSRACKLPN